MEKVQVVRVTVIHLVVPVVLEKMVVAEEISLLKIRACQSIME